MKHIVLKYALIGKFLAIELVSMSEQARNYLTNNNFATQTTLGSTTLANGQNLEFSDAVLYLPIYRNEDGSIKGATLNIKPFTSVKQANITRSRFAMAIDRLNKQLDEEAAAQAEVEKSLLEVKWVAAPDTQNPTTTKS